VRFDATGKVSLDHIYTQPDPRAYFSTLRRLEYGIPELAKPHFSAVIDEYRSVTGTSRPQVLDIGSSYGINGALLRCGLSMDDLYERYGSEAAQFDARDDLIARDRELPHLDSLRLVGLDVSAPALDYARESHFLDDTVCADFERTEPTEEQASLLATTDVAISTGCLGYVGAPTIERVVAACDRPPWMAHFVLRMFPFEPIAEVLAKLGYETEHQEGMFRQRRFASAAEKAQVLDTLSTVGVDPTGAETDGWFYAQLFVSKPR
jgi:carnitine O-acetyltransferase